MSVLSPGDIYNELTVSCLPLRNSKLYRTGLQRASPGLKSVTWMVWRGKQNPHNQYLCIFYKLYYAKKKKHLWITNWFVQPRFWRNNNIGACEKDLGKLLFSFHSLYNLEQRAPSRASNASAFPKAQASQEESSKNPITSNGQLLPTEIFLVSFLAR